MDARARLALEVTKAMTVPEDPEDCPVPRATTASTVELDLVE
jgi:hypothetical protein